MAVYVETIEDFEYCPLVDKTITETDLCAMHFPNSMKQATVGCKRMVWIASTGAIVHATPNSSAT
jgi:hypothetical protein